MENQGLLILPNDMIKIIIGYLDLHEINKLSRCCKKYRYAFEERKKHILDNLTGLLVEYSINYYEEPSYILFVGYIESSIIKELCDNYHIAGYQISLCKDHICDKYSRVIPEKDNSIPLRLLYQEKNRWKIEHEKDHIIVKFPYHFWYCITEKHYFSRSNDPLEIIFGRLIDIQNSLF